MNSGVIESLVSIDISQTRHHLLRQQHLLNNPFSSGQSLLQLFNRKLFTQRLRPQHLKYLCLTCLRPQLYTPKLTWISIEQPSSILQIKTHPAILRLRIRHSFRRNKHRSLELPHRRIAFSSTCIYLPTRRQQQQITGHPPVNRKKKLTTQINQQIFPPPPHIQNIPPSNLRQEIRHIRMAHRPLPKHLSIADSCPGDAGTKLAGCIFYFW